MKYKEGTESLMAECKNQGFNLWPMIGIFKRRSRLSAEIPDEVIVEVCKEYLGRMRAVRADFPYFLKVLKNKSEKYFALKNIREHDEIKKQKPLSIKEIFERCQNELLK